MAIKYVEQKQPKGKRLEAHPAANIFPMMDEPDFQELVEDIKQQGLVESIVLYEDKILDGRNRHKACKLAGVTPKFTHYHGNDPTGFAISLNLKRRHLTEGQRASIAAKLSKTTVGRPKKNSANLRNKDAAALLKVSERSVETAKQVHRDGTPELVDALDKGEVSANAASIIAREPTEVQEGVLSAKDEKRLNKAAQELATAARMRDEFHASPKMAPMPEAHAEALERGRGTQEGRDAFSCATEIIDLLAEMPEPQEFIELIPPALKHAINPDEFAKVSKWFEEFCQLYTPTKEIDHVTIEHSN